MKFKFPTLKEHWPEVHAIYEETMNSGFECLYDELAARYNQIKLWESVLIRVETDPIFAKTTWTFSKEFGEAYEAAVDILYSYYVKPRYYYYGNTDVLDVAMTLVAG